MKKFNKILSALLISLSICFITVACDNESGSEPVLNLSPEGDIDIPTHGGEVIVTVDTNLPEWDAEADLEWLEIKKGDGKFTVSAAPNFDKNPRAEATVTVTATDGTLKSISKTIKVSQAGTGIERLDRDGTSNSYIIYVAGTYSFDATTVGNGDEGIVDPAFHLASATIAPASAKLLWQDYYKDGKGLIESVELSAGRIIFTTAEEFVAGNAVIAACDYAGKILWSWHIWMPAVQVEGLSAATGYNVMNLNLGATTSETANPKSYGMLYQWGRKDPLPAAATLTGDTSTVGAPLYDMEGGEVKITNSSWTDNSNNTLLYAIENPTVCLSNQPHYATSRDWLSMSIDALWGNPKGHEKDTENNYINRGVKSVYDPCPVGWRVPPADVFRNLTTSGGYAWGDAEGNVPDFNIFDRDGDGSKNIGDWEYGWLFCLSEGVNSYFPAAARFDGSYAMLMGSMSGLWGSYWGNCGDESMMDIPHPGFCVLSFQVKDLAGNTVITASPSGSSGRADAYSVRCVQE